MSIFNPLLVSGTKGLPLLANAIALNQIGQQGWNILQGDLPYPIAVIRQQQLIHNLQWMQNLVEAHGVKLAPHGKTTLSPHLFKAQLDTGAWGITISSMAQLSIAIQAGATHCLIANQLVSEVDLNSFDQLQQNNPELQLYFLVDSLAQLTLLEVAPGHTPFKVLLEIGVSGGRTGVRDPTQAISLARALHASARCQLAGIECYEGLKISANESEDKAYIDDILGRMQQLIQQCEQEGLFDCTPILISAGGSAIFDQVLPALKPTIQTPFTGLLRSGCYITHDHGFYQRLSPQINRRLGCSSGLEAALEVWAMVQSMPEPNLAIVSMGKRDISYDLEMPIPLWVKAHEHTESESVAAPPVWTVSHMNDQHAYLRLNNQDQGLKVGDLVGFGVSHPCTTFDKWRWMPIVNERYDVIDAIATYF